MTEAVILDWAGTAIDYGSFAPVQAFQAAFRAFHIEPTLAETRAPMGMLKIEHIWTMLQMERIAAQWHANFGRVPNRDDAAAVYAQFEPKILSVLEQFATPKPHVLECVTKLRASGIRIGSTTGYTDKMMHLVVPKAAAHGYSPDCWFSPDAVNGYGRPFPYMIFRNFEALNLHSVQGVVKVGDTVSDIQEGKNAGLYTIGVLEGSSQMGLSQAEYEALTAAEQQRQKAVAASAFYTAGADAVLDHLGQLPLLLRQLAN